MIEFSYKPHLGLLLPGGALLLLLFWWSYRRAKGRPATLLQVVLTALRLAAITVAVICLLDPQWVAIIKHEQKSRVAVLLDTSRSMTIQDLPGGRLKVAKEWIAGKVLPSAPPGVVLSTYGFDQSLVPLGPLDSASATGTVTALSETLERLLTLPAVDPLTGVILVSDGIDTTSKMPEQVAKLYRRRGVPIHTVAAGTTNEMRDVIIENVHVKRAVPNEAPTRVALAIRSPGYNGQTVSIQIRGQKQILAAKELKLNGRTQSIELDVTPRQKGFQVYEAIIVPVAGEWLASNNRRTFGLEVVDPTIRVIYMEGTPQQPSSPVPEWKYLKDALESDPGIKVKTLYRQVGGNGQFLNTVDVDPENGQKIYPVEHPTKGFPKTMEDLLEYDVIIHSDIKKDSFTTGQLDNIARLVYEHGGGFLMIGGNSAFGKGGYHRTILDKIIPVAMERENDSQATTVKMQVPRAMFTHPIINIGATPEETEAIWTTKFPRFHGYNRVDHAKPGAIVLGENPGYRNESGLGVLLAVQEIGKGRSMAFTSDTTRSWGRDFETLWGEPIRKGSSVSEENCDSRYYRQFWVNAIRWLATGKLERTNSPVTLELAQSYCSPGESVAAVVKVRDAELNEISNAQVSLLLSSEGRTNTAVRARYDSATRSYLAEVRGGTNGTFLVSAIVERSGKKLGDDRQLIVCEGTDLEMQDVRARPDFMASLAKQTKGETFTLGDQGGASPNYVFAQAPPPTIEYRRTSFWDKPGWMALILGLLASEWALRRIRGLA
jgi:uncharacterized membrane protein